MGYYELKFSSHDHSDTKQAQPWSCIGRYRGHGLKLPGRYAGLGERKSHDSLVWCLMGYHVMLRSG